MSDANTPHSATRRRIRGVCPHDCPDTCGLLYTVDEGKVTRVEGDREHPVTQGWLCGKVNTYPRHVHHPDRLLYPLRRVASKGEGRWQRTSWSDALDEIAERWQQIVAEFGAEAILPYSYSGTLGLVQMDVCNTRFWNRLGASRLLRTICGAAAEWAVRATLGGRLNAPYSHIRDSKLVIVWGHNPISTAPHVMPHLRQAQRDGCYLVVVDPRRTRTARGADLHIAPRPGTDAALALGLAHVIVEQQQHDLDWLGRNTVGWAALARRLKDYDPARVAHVTGVRETVITDLATRYARTRPGLIKIADGINRNRNGGQSVRAVCMLPAITGQYGKRGAGLSYSTSDQFAWDRAALHHREVGPPPGRKVNMNRLGAALSGEVTDPPIQGLYVYGANPAAVSPNAGLIVEGLKRTDLFTVVHELFMTDTADYADIVLPATTQLEQTDLHKGYGHGYIAYNHKTLEPLGEARSNWEVMGLLASRFGFEEPWLHQTPDEVIEEILGATAMADPRLAGITLQRLKNEGPLSIGVTDQVPFADLRFPTPSGKVELYSQALVDRGLPGLPEWVENGDLAPPPEGMHEDGGLDLVTPAPHHFVTSSFANQDELLRREGRPFVEIHPQDAAVRGIDDGDEVLIENRRGWCRINAVVTDAVRRGVAVSPKGWWSKSTGGRNVNWTTPDTLADFAGQSTFHTNRVWIRKARHE
jgi:anaerobic selenocysteine-containing dehydrogenase